MKHDQPAEGNPSPAVPHRLPAGQTDDELAYEACEGDREAFGELTNRHSVRLRRTLYRITKDCEMAKDSVQEALIRAWGAVCSFERRSKFSSWLTRIGINEAYRELGKGRRTLSLDADAERTDQLVDRGPSPDEIAESKAALASIGRALDELPEAYREAVVLRDVEGLSIREAAETVGIGERALKSRLHRGRSAMVASLDRDLVGTPG